MSPVPEESRLAALSALSGSGALLMPPPGPERAVLAVDLIGRARRSQATWAAIGKALGVAGPKAAKAEVRKIARAAAAGKPFAFSE